MGHVFTRRELLKTAGATSAVCLAGCSGSDTPTSTPASAVHDAAAAFRSLLEQERQDTEYLTPAAAEGGFVDVTKTGETTYEVTAGSTDFTDTSLCAGGDPGVQAVKAAFEPGLGYPRWLGTFAAQLYERLGPVNAAYRDADEAAIETYAFRFETDAATITFAASGEQMADWAFEDDQLDRELFEEAFFAGMTASCSTVTTDTATETRSEEPTAPCAASEIHIEAVNGYDTSDAGIGRVSVVMRISGDCTFNIAEAELSWIGDVGLFTYTPAVAPSDEAVVAEPTADSDGSFPTLNAASDRAVVELDLTQISEPLPPGSTGIIQFRRGPSVTITVPDPLPEDEPVTLA